MSTFVYMKVTNDIYELPVAVADSGSELAKILGVKKDTVYSNISRARSNNWNSTYLRVEIDENEED